MLVKAIVIQSNTDWTHLPLPTTDSGDFTASEQLVTFLPGDLSRVVEVTVSSDGLLEEEEEFVCVLSVPAGETGVVLGRSTTTVIIGDSDGTYFLVEVRLCTRDV